VCEAGSVLLWPEYGYRFVIRRSESFQAFISLLAIVETRGHAMETKEWVGNEGWRRPFASLDAVVGFDVAINYFDMLDRAPYPNS